MKPATKQYSFRFLGSVTVESDGRRLEATLPQKGLALLAYLATTPGVPQARRKLADFFWPELSEEAGRNNLRQVLLGLKRTLGAAAEPPCLITTRNEVCYQAVGHCSSDLADFLLEIPACQTFANNDDCAVCLPALQAKADLYRGSFLENLMLEGSPEFDSWLQIQRERLEQRALFMLERIASCHENQGRLDDALAAAERFAELAPWSDEGIRRVIRLAALTGQRGFALNRYQAFCRTLKAELGVQPESKTRQLAQNIQNGELLPYLAPAAPPLESAAELPSQSLERRQVTICYCRLLPLQAGDPDEEYELLKIPLQRCKEVLQRSGAYLLENMSGAGVLAYFGFPQARENMAALAVNASLHLKNLDLAGVRLQIAIHSGLVLSAMDKLQPDVIGRITGRVLELANLAANKDILISRTVYERVQNFFECREVATRPVPEEPIAEPCYLIVGAAFSESHLDRLAGMPPLVGREQELAKLKECWAAVTKGAGKALLVQGEPGIGKSRLLSSFREILPATGCLILDLRCSFEFSQSPFQPVINLLKRSLGFQPGADPAARSAKLADAISLLYPDDSGQILSAAAELLAVPVNGRNLASGITVPQRRQLTLTLLLELLAKLASQRSVLVVVEDLHWSDPSTLELVELLLEQGVPNGLCLLLTARPEFAPPWQPATVASVRLGPLSNQDIAAIVTAVGPDTGLSLRQQIVARADGVPLFAEELSRLPTGFAEGDAPAVPASLHDLLATRLDRLGQDKRLAQLAATIGREFSPQLVAKLTLLEEEETIAALLRLKQVGLVAILTADRWQFRHALFRDAAYLSQTRGDREAAHRQIAEILTADYPEIGSSQPELLAYHWTSAGAFEPAINSWLQAGLQAQSHSAHQEAVRHFNAGLALLTRLEPAQQSLHREWQFLVGLGASAYATEGYASPQGAAAYLRAVELGEQKESPEQSFPALWGLWAGASSHANWGHSLHLAKRLVKIVQNGKDPLARQQGYFALGNVQFWRGEFLESRRCLEKSLQEYLPERHMELESSYGENAFATGSGYLSWNLCVLGFPREALAAGQQAVAEAERCGHPFSLGYALTFLTVLQRMRRQPRLTLELAERTIALAQKHDFPLWLVGATVEKGWAKTMLGQPDGLTEMQWSLDQVASLMSGISVIFLETQVDSLRCAGQTEKALTVIERAFELIEQLDDHHAEAELYRHKGLCLQRLSAGNAEPAEACLRQALQISRRQAALLYELRAAIALNRLLNRQGRGEEGRRLLTDVRQRLNLTCASPHLLPAVV